MNINTESGQVPRPLKCLNVALAICDQPHTGAYCALALHDCVRSTGSFKDMPVRIQLRRHQGVLSELGITRNNRLLSRHTSSERSAVIAFTEH